MSDTPAPASPVSLQAVKPGPPEDSLDFHKLSDLIPHMVWSARADGVSDYYNTRFLQYLGKTLEEMQGWTWAETLHPDDQQRSIEAWTNSFTKGGEFSIEYRIRRAADGQFRWHEGRAVPTRDAAGNITRWFGTCTDIEERKQHEESLTTARHDLEQKHDILKAVMEGAKNSHLVFLDRDFNFVLVNETYARTCGYHPEEMIGKNHFALYPHAENEAIFTRVRDTGEAYAVKDKPFKFPDQPERGVTYWDWTLIPAKDSAGAVIGLVFSLFETTERRLAEEALRKGEERYRAIVDGQTEFVNRYLPGGIMTYVNPALARWFGFKAEELIGKSFYPFIHEDQREATIQKIEALSCDNPVAKIEQQVYSPDGRQAVLASVDQLRVM